MKRTVSILLSILMLLSLMLPALAAAEDIQYVLYLGTNDKDTNEPVFTQEEAMEQALGILLRHFGGYTIQEAHGGWLGDDGTLYTEYTLVIYLSDTDLDAVHAAADEMIEVFHQSSVLIQANKTQTEFYYGGAESEEAAMLEPLDDLHASRQPVIDSPDWVKALRAAQHENVTQLFVVAAMGMDKTTATVSMHQRDENGQWKQILSTPGFIGRNGLCPDADHAEGCGQTPIGIYTFNKAFGIAEDPGCALPYTQVTDDIYWSGDQREGMRYNEMVSLNDYPDLDVGNSEHIVDYEYEYQYCLNISFNDDATPNKGSAIFLHCFGLKKPQTGGCVALPENIMRLVMQSVQPDCVVVIDTLENLGGSL